VDVSKHLSLKHITFFYHGGALLEYQGMIPVKDGNTTYMMAIDPDEAEQVLSTLTVIDLDGGAVTKMIYQPPKGVFSDGVDPRSFFQSLLSGLVGKNISVVMDDENSISGVLVGLDVEESSARRDLYLNLLSSDQIHRVKSSDIKSLSIGKNDSLELKSVIRGEVKAYVGWEIDPGLPGKDKHRVSVRYLQPVERWNVLYHLYMLDNTWILLVWCSVSNPTSKDWKNVSITITTNNLSTTSKNGQPQGDGETITYNVSDPVTIPKFSKILIPVSRLEVEGELKAIRGMEGDQLSLTIRNKSGRLWLPGKLVVWKDNGSLVGTGEIPLTRNGEAASIVLNPL